MRPPVIPPPEIRYKGRDWILIEHPANRKKGTRRSKAWDYGDDYIAVDDTAQHAWRCKKMQGRRLLSSDPRQVDFACVETPEEQA